MYYVTDKQHLISSAVVAPRDVPEVQAIVRLANEFEIPLWPFSIGRNVGYGGAAPRVPGSIGVDMGRNMVRYDQLKSSGSAHFVSPLSGRRCALVWVLHSIDMRFSDKYRRNVLLS